MFFKEFDRIPAIAHTGHNIEWYRHARLICHLHQVFHQALKNIDIMLDPDIDRSLWLIIAQSCALTSCQKHRPDLSGADRFKSCLFKLTRPCGYLIYFDCVKRRKHPTLRDRLSALYRV